MEIKKKNSRITESNNLEKLIQRMGADQKVRIYPHHDFVDNTLYYSFFIDKVGHIINSKGQAFKYDDAEKHNIELIHTKNSISKLNRTVLERFKEREKVECYNCYNDIVKYIKAQVYLSDSTDYSILALWAMATYMARIFDKCMYIWINGEMGTGKTTLMESMSTICFNGLLASNIKQAALIRSIDADGSSVFIDEKENLLSSDESDTKLALNSGFNRDATIIKCNKEHEPVEYNVYSFKMIAGINKIPATLIDRSYVIKTQKKEGSFKEKLSRQKKYALAKRIVESLYLIGLTYAKEISEIYEKPEVINIPDVIKNRDLDKWLPLFTIAKFIDDNYNSQLVDELSNTAERKFVERYNEQIVNNPKYLLAKYLCEFIECSKGLREKSENKVYTTKCVYDYFIKEGILEEIFPEFKYKRPTKCSLTQTLKKYLGINSHTYNFRESSVRCYKLDESYLKDIIKKYDDKLLKY